MVSIILPSQTFIIVCGTADGRLYRVDCVAQAHAAQNQALSVIPLQQAEVTLLCFSQMCQLAVCCEMAGHKSGGS